MMIITGKVHALVRNCKGEIVQEVFGPNAVVEMSNNILMDAVFPKLGTNAAPTAIPNRPEGTNMTDNTTFPSGGNFIGAGGADQTIQEAARNHIAYIAIGDNEGSNDTGVANQNQKVTMVDTDFDPTNAVTVYARRVDSVTFPAYNQVRFTTTYSTAQGNLAGGIAEIGLWTAGDNADADGFLTNEVPTASTNMRLFARKILANTITKTDDGTLEINYTLTFGA